MKKQNYFVLRILLVGIVSLGFTQTLCASEKGNGGNFIRAQFYTKAQTILTHVQAGLIDAGVSIDAGRLEELIDQTEVEISIVQLFDKNNKPVDALNFYPATKKIVLYEKTWQGFLSLGSDTYSLVAHELFKGLNIPDERHEVSRKLKIAPPAWSCQGFKACGMRLGYEYEYGVPEDSYIYSEGMTRNGAFHQLVRNSRDAQGKRCQPFQLELHTFVGMSGASRQAPISVPATASNSCDKN